MAVIKEKDKKFLNISLESLKYFKMKDIFPVQDT